MKAMSVTCNALVVFLATASAAFAAATTKVYSSGILLFAFLGLCALVVVAQLLPALVVLFGMVKGLLKKEKDVQLAEVE
jgi:hypothetical protein